jgi:hypothetical protein
VEVLNLVDTVCSGGETGLLGVAVDPEFSGTDSRFIYLYYTDSRGDGGCGAENRANRVSRFTMDDNGTIGNEQVLIDNIPAPGGNHNAGDLQFDKDGLLYISVGDGGRDLITGEFQDGNGNARRLDLLNGKILRITSDGGIPAGNPFQGDGTMRCSDTGGATSEVEAAKKNKKKSKKKRGGKSKKPKKRERKRERKQRKRERKRSQNQNQNPGLNPGPDVGGGSWEEISDGGSGADYGWNVREGPCPVGVDNCQFEDTEFVEPLFAYSHDTGCRTITGSAFVPDGAGWGNGSYDDVYLYADFICDKLFALRDESTGEIPEEFGTGTAATHLKFGPDDVLYYTTFDGGGQVRQIFYDPS